MENLDRIQGRTKYKKRFGNFGQKLRALLFLDTLDHKPSSKWQSAQRKESDESGLRQVPLNMGGVQSTEQGTRHMEL